MTLIVDSLLKKKTKKAHPLIIVYIFAKFAEQKTEVPRDVRNSKVRRQDKLRRHWSRH